MPRFFARVELVDAPDSGDTWQLYERLHAHMAGAGFTRIVNGVQSGQKVSKQLPDATYYAELDCTHLQARDFAWAAAVKVHHKPRVLVIESAAFAWKGLASAS